MSDMSALDEALEFKRILEKSILQELKRFSDISGLRVDGINVKHQDITNLHDEHRKYVYAVELEITV